MLVDMLEDVNLSLQKKKKGKTLMTNHKKVGANFVHRPNVLKFDFMRFSVLSHLRLELFPAPEFSVSSSPGSQWEEAGQGFLHLHPGPHVHRPKSAGQ